MLTRDRRHQWFLHFIFNKTSNQTHPFFSLPPPLPVSHHWLPVQSDRGRSIGHLPSVCRRQLRPSLLFHSVPWKPHGVPRPGDIKRRRSQNLDNWPPLPDGRHQWWRLAGQTAAHTWPISFKQKATTQITNVMWSPMSFAFTPFGFIDFLSAQKEALHRNKI